MRLPVGVRLENSCSSNCRKLFFSKDMDESPGGDCYCHVNLSHHVMKVTSVFKTTQCLFSAGAQGAIRVCLAMRWYAPAFA
ncbi:hypothetical protein EMIT0196P_20509 [Pseudomonas chlororaphis]